MNLIDAAKQAQEALEDTDNVLRKMTGGSFAKIGLAIAALRTAIADAKRCEPVAHVYTLTKTGSLASWEPTAAAFLMGDGQHKLYTRMPMLTDAAVERAALSIANADRAQSNWPPVQTLGDLCGAEQYREQARAALAAAWEAK